VQFTEIYSIVSVFIVIIANSTALFTSSKSRYFLFSGYEIGVFFRQFSLGEIAE